jgi:hypothetical protein
LAVGDLRQRSERCSHEGEGDTISDENSEQVPLPVPYPADHACCMRVRCWLSFAEKPNALDKCENKHKELEEDAEEEERPKPLWDADAWRAIGGGGC